MTFEEHKSLIQQTKDVDVLGLRLLLVVMDKDIDTLDTLSLSRVVRKQAEAIGATQEQIELLTLKE